MLAEQLARKRLLIFDLDGTLVDSSPLHARAFAQVCAPFSITVDYARVAGLTTEAALDHLMRSSGVQLTSDERDTLIKRKRALSLALIESDLQPLPGAMSFVRAAGGKWLRALCTSASRAGAEASLRRAGIYHCFDWIVTGNDVARGKPDPEIFLAALDHAGVAPVDALVFEDAPSGLAAAEAARIEAIQIVTDASRSGSSQVSWSMLNEALGRLEMPETSA